jgi:hypothetical protein
MNRAHPEVALYKRKRKILEDAIRKKFQGKLAGRIVYGGSIAKGTAINISFDVDLIIPFSHSSNSLEYLANQILQFFKKEFKDKDLKKIRNQRVSIGLTFRTTNGCEIRIDVVPGREQSLGDYAITKKLNLYDYFEKRYFQTNVSKQIQLIKNSHSETRDVIKLLKIWRTGKEFKGIKSFLIEMIVLDALKKKQVHHRTGLDKVLVIVADHIQSSISSKRLVDPGNSRNVVSDLLSQNLRNRIGIDMRKVLKAMRNDPKLLEQLFPVRSIS